jgi:hypothetical protein
VLYSPKAGGFLKKHRVQVIITALLATWFMSLQAATQQQPQAGQVGQRGRGGQVPQLPPGQLPARGQAACIVDGAVLPCPPGQSGPRPATANALRLPEPNTVGRVTRLDTNEGLANVRVELGAAPQKQPTGYDKPCKPQTVLVPPDARRFAISDATGRFVFEGGPAAAVATSPEEETNRQILELERLRRQAERGVQSAPPGANVSISRDPRESNAFDLPLNDAVSFATSGALRGEREGFEWMPWAAGVGMAPAPTIGGRIVDASMKPVSGATVQAYSVRYTPLGRSLKWVKSTLTDDLGNYRLFWLPFGRYYVVAGNSDYVRAPWAEGLRTTPNLPESDLGLPLLFYPGVIGATDAAMIRLVSPTVSKPATPMPVANLALRERPRFNVKVRLLADPMPPNSNLVFLPYGGDLCAGMDYAIQPHADGTFDVRDVPEGLYVLVALRGRDTISPLITLNVNKNIDEVALPLVPSSSISGTITFTGAPGVDLTPILKDLRVNLTRAGSEVSHVATAQMDPVSHNFTIPGLGPGFYYPTLDLPRGSYIKNIRVMKFNRGSGVCDTLPIAAYSYVNANGHLQPLEIARVIPGDNKADPSCLNIEVSFEGQLQGRVHLPVCVPPPAPCPTPMNGSVMVLFPKRSLVKQSANDVTPPDRILTTLSGEGGPGRWEFRGLPMDEDYILLSVPGLEPDLVYAPGFSDVLSARTFQIPGSTNACPEYRRRVPESDPFVPSHCEVATPVPEVLAEAIDRLFK